MNKADLSHITRDINSYLKSHRDLTQHEALKPLLQQGLNWFSEQRDISGNISHVFQAKARRVQTQDPHVALTIHTHGHEIAGLMVGLILAQMQQQGKLVLDKGTLTIALNNPEALQRFINAKSDHERTLSRFVDEDMNRLKREENPKLTSERKRFEELSPLFDKFTHALDFHTTPYDTPLLVFPAEVKPEVVQGWPQALFEHAPLCAVSHVARALYPETTLSEGYGKGKAESFTMELGSNTDIASVQRGLVVSLHLFHRNGIINDATLKNALDYLVEEQFIPREYAAQNAPVTGFDCYESHSIVRVPKDGKNYYAVEIKPYAGVSLDQEVLNCDGRPVTYEEMGGKEKVCAIMPRLPGKDTNVPVIPGSALFYATDMPKHYDIPSPDTKQTMTHIVH